MQIYFNHIKIPLEMTFKVRTTVAVRQGDNPLHVNFLHGTLIVSAVLIVFVAKPSINMGI